MSIRINEIICEMRSVQETFDIIFQFIILLESQEYLKKQLILDLWNCQGNDCGEAMFILVQPHTMECYNYI